MFTKRNDCLDILKLVHKTLDFCNKYVIMSCKKKIYYKRGKMGKNNNKNKNYKITVLAQFLNKVKYGKDLDCLRNELCKKCPCYEICDSLPLAQALVNQGYGLKEDFEQDIRKEMLGEIVEQIELSKDEQYISEEVYEYLLTLFQIVVGLM